MEAFVASSIPRYDVIFSVSLEKCGMWQPLLPKDWSTNDG
jgi:hypothetical protein